MISLGQLGKTAGIIIGTAAGLAGVGAIAALRRPLPRTSGTLPLPGLQAPVRVIRDRWGVPHIYAANSEDLFMAQGYVHAQDRLWQMEFQRRAASGQLAELFGAIALDSDRFVRVLGFRRVAEREADSLDDETRRLVEAYVRGINAFIEQHAGNLPIEFTVLRLRPRPWTVADVLVWGRMMALQLSRNWREELVRARLVATVGAERAAALTPHYPDDHPIIVPPGVHYTPTMGQSAMERADAAARFFPDGAGQGSNSWAVAAHRAAGGGPLLASDPHLAITMPSLWYENHLSGGDFHVTGASIPGTPGVIIGHNEHIAWGITNSGNDVQDLYLEKFDPTDLTGLRYEYQGQWETAELVREEIVVRGQREVVIEEVRITRHGPIINALLPEHAQNASNGEALRAEQPLAMRWTALAPSRLMRAVFRLNRARDWESFREALADWTVPPQNFTYADVEGNIGYALGGDIPLRAKGDGSVPVPGWTGEYEWVGIIPHAELPHVLNPPEGFVITANNRVVGDSYPYPFPAEWLNGYRAERIRQLIEQTPRHDVESFARIHADVRSLPGLELAALAGRLPADDPLAQQARDALATWNGELSADSIGGTIYSRLRERLLSTIYADAAPAFDVTVGLGAFATLPGRDIAQRAFPRLLRRLIERDDRFFGERTTDEILTAAWNATLAELRAELGDDVTTWRYGRIHSLTIRHPLGSIPALATIFNRGPFPTGGDLDTVNMGYLPREFAGPPFYIAPSYRQICDTADWDRSQSIQPTGQSGHPGSRHYSDFVQPWLNVQYHPMPWSRSRVEEVAASRMTLQPTEEQAAGAVVPARSAS
ncbi:MAG: penicillin acylase family protein [Roseiflexaceae bacterium]|nr:penicillin acylase family protein [Roseiflexaceae bacterium]